MNYENISNIHGHPIMAQRCMYKYREISVKKSLKWAVTMLTTISRKQDATIFFFLGGGGVIFLRSSLRGVKVSKDWVLNEQSFSSASLKVHKTEKETKGSRWVTSLIVFSMRSISHRQKRGTYRSIPRATMVLRRAKCVREGFWWQLRRRHL